MLDDRKNLANGFLSVGFCLAVQFFWAGGEIETEKSRGAKFKIIMSLVLKYQKLFQH